MQNIIKKILKKTSRIIGCVSLAFFMNSNPVKAVGNRKDQTEIIKLISDLNSLPKEEIEKTVTILDSYDTENKTTYYIKVDKIKKKMNEVQEKPKTKFRGVPRKLGGGETITQYNYEAFMRKTVLWLEKYEQENQLKNLKTTGPKIPDLPPEITLEDILLPGITLEDIKSINTK